MTAGLSGIVGHAIREGDAVLAPAMLDELLNLVLALGRRDEAIADIPPVRPQCHSGRFVER
jgi:hypothetical protein